MNRFIAASFVIALTACSGGGGALVPKHTPAARATATLTIHWASSSSAQAKQRLVSRRPFFISPAAKSIGVQVSPAGSTDPSGFVTTTINKPATGTTSTVTFGAPAGNDDIVFAVFDQPDLGGNKVGGTELTQTIVAGVANSVNATLDGYVGSVSVGSTSPFFTVGTDSGGETVLTLVGEMPVPVTLTLKDIDGNVIIPPGTAPVAQFTSSDASVKLTPSSAAPNAYTIQAVAPNSGYGLSNGSVIATPILLQINVSSGTGEAQQYATSFPIQQKGLIYATAASGGTATMNLIDQSGKAYALPGQFAGLNAPVAMVWDDVDGALFVLDAGLGKILAFDASGNPWSGWTAPSVKGGTSITYDVSEGEVYATTAAASGAPSDAVLAFDKHGNPVTLGGFSGLSTPIAITYAGGNLLVVNRPASAPALVTIYDPSGAAVAGTPYAFPSSFVPNACLVSFFDASTSVSKFGWGGDILGTSGGTGSDVSFSVDNAGNDSYYPQFSGQGLTNPIAAVVNPLYNGRPANNIVNGTQPDLFYAINAPGGIVAINGAQLQDTSVTFPAPPSSPNYTALAITY